MKPTRISTSETFPVVKLHFIRGVHIEGTSVLACFIGYVKHYILARMHGVTSEKTVPFL